MKLKTIWSLQKMNIVVLTSHYLPGYKGGGPIKTIKNLIDQLGCELSFKLVTNDRDFGDTSPYEAINYDTWNKVGNAEVIYIQPNIAGYKKMSKILNKKDYDIIYLNSFFSVRFSFVPILIAKTSSKKVILAPRGEFSEGALSLKFQKKRMFIKLWKSLHLHHGTIFQASSHYEAEDIRKVLGSNADIFIAENIGSQEFANTLPIRDNSLLTLVFISRISPKKNLLLALQILQNVELSVSYHIYGPIEDHDYWAECKAIIEVLPANIQVEYEGELYPNEVISTLSKYDAFFMPTKGENYGHVIAEALCAGLPILIADTTPWRNLQELGIGWDLPLSNLKAFGDAIDQLAIMSVDDHHQMRKQVLAWAKNKFSQRDAIEANIAMFNYAANK